MTLESLGRSVAMDIVAYFTVRFGEQGDLLKRQFQALQDEARQEEGAAARPFSSARKSRPGPVARPRVVRARSIGK